MHHKKRNIIIANYLIPYFIVSITSFIIMATIINLGKVDISVPLTWAGDGLYFDAMIKSIIDSEALFINHYLAAPYSTNFYDFPAMGYFDLYLIKLIGLFVRDWAYAVNFYYFITYPITSCITFYVLRKMNFSSKLSGVIAIIYSILPYHFFRGQGHLNLISYYFIPLAILTVYLIFEKTETGRAFNFNLYQIKKFYPIYIYSFFLGLQVTYYIFFTLIFLMVTAFIMQFGFKKSGSFKLILSVIAIILFVMLLSMIPSLIYQISHGSIDILGRTEKDFNYYSLKVIQIFTPVAGHRIELFTKINSILVNSLAFPQNEDLSVCLGIFGSVSFTASLLFVFIRTKLTEKNQFLILLSFANIFLVLIATYGGIGNILYIFIDAIRCYNRIIVFIALISFITAAYLLKELERIVNKNIYFILIFTIFVGTCFDFSSNFFVVKQNQFEKEYYEMNEYVKEIESQGENQMIFQLPYTGGVPNTIAAGSISYYESYKPYLFSNNIRWSYGSTNEREGDVFCRSVSKMPIEQMLYSLKKNEFTGVLVDSFGYDQENLTQLVGSLNQLVKKPSIISDNSRYIYYDIAEVNQADLRKVDLAIDWGKGFYDLENDQTNNWRWGEDNANLNFINFEDYDIILSLQAEIEIPDIKNNKISLRLTNKEIYQNIGQSQLLKRNIKLKPGVNELKFETNGERVEAPNDGRNMHFMLRDFSIKSD